MPCSDLERKAGKLDLWGEEEGIEEIKSDTHKKWATNSGIKGIEMLLLLIQMAVDMTGN